MPCCRCGVLLVLCVCPLACLLTSPCPTSCCCPRSGRLVLCESLGLRSLPLSVPLSTVALSVARNQLCNVDHLLQPLSGLQELSLSHNQLARFPRGLPSSLETLQLQENRIAYITAGTLRQLGNLTRLDLEHNRIRAIQPGALQGLERLQVLILKGNKLTSLPLNLPPSLTRLDLSDNRISVLDLPSLSALVNLQVLKINGNRLRSVPESAFDSLPRLQSVDLADNLWVCECDILYLYRWLLRGRPKMAPDLVCTEPVHLAHHLLLNLSAVAICPRVLKPTERSHRFVFSSSPERTLETPTVTLTAPGFKSSFVKRDLVGVPDGSSQQKSKGTSTTVELLSEVHDIQDVPLTRMLSEHYSLETLSYEECLSLNATPSVNQPHGLPTTSPPDGETRCPDSVTARHPQSNPTSIEGTGSLLSTSKAGSLPTPNPGPSPQDSAVVVSLLAALCVLVSLLMLGALLVVKRVLAHHQRVAPLQQS